MVTCRWSGWWILEKKPPDFLNFLLTGRISVLTLVIMIKRPTPRYWRIVAAGALVVAVMGVASPALADEPAEPPADEPVEPVDEPVADVPATGELDGAIVAVGAPPVPAPPEPVVAVGAPPVPAPPEPVVAVGQPPVPARHAPLAAEPPAPAESAALVDTASAVLDLIGDLL
jgi:hypothetical protein